MFITFWLEGEKNQPELTGSIYTAGGVSLSNFIPDQDLLGTFGLNRPLPDLDPVATIWLVEILFAFLILHLLNLNIPRGLSHVYSVLLTLGLS